MSNPILLSCVLAAPIERIRGGVVVVALNCTFKLENGTEVQVSGLATTSKDDETSIYEARQRAIQDATNQLAVLGVEVSSTVTPKPVVELLQQFAEVEASRVIEEKRANGNAAQAEKLEGPSTPKVQQEINQLCEHLGITPFNVLDEEAPFTLGSAIALKTELDKKVKRFTTGEGLEGKFKRG